MSLYALHLANGRTSNTGVLRALGKLLTGSGVVQSTAFSVSAQTTPDMTVKVSGSTAADDLFITDSAGNTYYGWNTAPVNVTISSNATGSTKTDAVVAYIDTAFTTTTPDNPGGLVLTTVRGASGNPTSTEINTAISSKPYLILAYVMVANGASSINTGNITDVRLQTWLNQPVNDASLTLSKIASEVWTSYTPAWTSSGTAPSIGNGTLTGRYFKAGRFVRFDIFVTPGTTTTYGTGNWFWSLPVPQRADNSVTYNNKHIGTSYWINGGNGAEYLGVTRLLSSANPTYPNLVMAAYQSIGTNPSPLTNLAGTFASWGVGSFIHLSGSYEAAS